MGILDSFFNSTQYQSIENIRTDGAYSFSDEGVLYFLIFQPNGKISWLLDGFRSSWEVSFPEVLLKLKDISERVNHSSTHANKTISSNNCLLLSFITGKNITNLSCQLKKDGNLDVRKDNGTSNEYLFLKYDNFDLWKKNL